MNKILSFIIGTIVIFVLSGCMYPQENLVQNQIPYKEQIESVQSAVNQFQEDNGGILPIKTKDAKTPIYQKYPIDFQKIIPRYMAEAPGNAFESGGIFQYVLINVEKDATVKLLDLRMAETIREIKIRMKAGGYPPFKEKIANDIYTIDFRKLGYQTDPYAVSPYTNDNLPFVISSEAEVYIDYRSDLYKKLKSKDYSFKQGEDIRRILWEDSMFVPAYSLPYTIEKETNEPIFLVK